MDKNNHTERILVAVTNTDHLFRMATEILQSDALHLFLLSDGTRIDGDEYLTLFRMRGGGGGQKGLPTSFSPVASTNVRISPPKLSHF